MHVNAGGEYLFGDMGDRLPVLNPEASTAKLRALLKGGSGICLPLQQPRGGRQGSEGQGRRGRVLRSVVSQSRLMQNLAFENSLTRQEVAHGELRPIKMQVSKLARRGRWYFEVALSVHRIEARVRQGHLLQVRLELQLPGREEKAFPGPHLVSYRCINYYRAGKVTERKGNAHTQAVNSRARLELCSQPIDADELLDTVFIFCGGFAHPTFAINSESLRLSFTLLGIAISRVYELGTLQPALDTSHTQTLPLSTNRTHSQTVTLDCSIKLREKARKGRERRDRDRDSRESQSKGRMEDLYEDEFEEPQ
jgi:hypothetical protein